VVAEAPVVPVVPVVPVAAEALAEDVDGSYQK